MAKKHSQYQKQGAPKQSAPKKKSNLPLIVLAVILACAAAVAVFVGNRSGGDSGNLAGNPTAGTQTIAAGEFLTIPTADVTATATFYPVEVDGTAMEVFAIRASDGTVRTAFNTCQSCYTSGRGYYVQEGDDLVCQNCGFHVTPDQVEIQSGGCNPWPIFASDKTVTEDSIQISYDFLKESSGIFARWKV